MTQSETERAERDAKKDAAKFGLLLLLLFRKRHGFDGHKVEFDASTAKFRIDGRAVSVTSIRMYLTRIEDRMGKRLLKITTELENRQISFDQWKREFDRTITSMHILAGALVLGSITAAAHHRSVQETIDAQLRFADDFANELRKKAIIPRSNFRSQEGEQHGVPRGNFSGLADGEGSNRSAIRFKGTSMAKVRARAKSYVQAAHLNFSNLELNIRIALGADTEAKRVLRVAEHCHNSAATPGCLNLAQKGWMPIEDMVPIGKATCGRFCRCYIVYR